MQFTQLNLKAKLCGDKSIFLQSDYALILVGFNPHIYGEVFVICQSCVIKKVFRVLIGFYKCPTKCQGWQILLGKGLLI